MWTRKTPQLQQDQHFEINSLAVDPEIGRLYAGSGDCAVYAFDVEAGKQVGVLTGHKNYIHSVAALPKSTRTFLPFFCVRCVCCVLCVGERGRGGFSLPPGVGVACCL